MADNKEAKTVGSDFAEYLNKVAKVTDDTANVSLSDLKGFYKSKGITEAQIAQWSEVQKEISTGVYKYTADKVLDKVEELKKAGKKDEAENYRFNTKMNIPGGIQKFTVKAVTSSASPQDRSKTVTHYGTFRDVIKLSRSIDKTVTADYEDRIMKALTGK